MTDKPTPQLRQALAELLGQKAAIPDHIISPMTYELDVQLWGNRAYDGIYMRPGDNPFEEPKAPNRTAMPEGQHGDYIRVVHAGHTFNANRPVDFQNPGTLRQLLSAYPRHGWQDPFVLEASRKAKLDSPQYQKWLSENPEIKEYMRFFTTLTDIVDHDRLPEGVTTKDIPGIMRYGLHLFREEAKKHKSEMEKSMASLGSSDPKREALRHLIERATILGFGTSEWEMTPENRKMLLEHTQQVRGIYPSNDDYIDHLIDYIIDNELLDLDKLHSHHQKHQSGYAGYNEDIAAIYGSVCANITTACKKGGIAHRMPGDFGPN